MMLVHLMLSKVFNCSYSCSEEIILILCYFAVARDYILWDAGKEWLVSSSGIVEAMLQVMAATDSSQEYKIGTAPVWNQDLWDLVLGSAASAMILSRFIAGAQEVQGRSQPAACARPGTVVQSRQVAFDDFFYVCHLASGNFSLATSMCVYIHNYMQNNIYMQVYIYIYTYTCIYASDGLCCTCLQWANRDRFDLCIVKIPR